MAQAPSNNYPFSTKDGKVIPLDVLGTKGVVIAEFNEISANSIVIPTTKEVAILYASEDCILAFESSNIPSTIAYNTEITDAFFCPKGHAIAVRLTSGNVKVLGLSTVGKLVIQFIERWSGIDLDISYVMR